MTVYMCVVYGGGQPMVYTVCGTIYTSITQVNMSGYGCGRHMTCGDGHYGLCVYVTRLCTLSLADLSLSLSDYAANTHTRCCCRHQFAPILSYNTYVHAVHFILLYVSTSFSDIYKYILLLYA